MIKTTTPNEIILHLYEESTEQTQEEFRLECLMNTMLSELKDEFEEVKTSLDELSFQPSRANIQQILMYSASFMPKH
jgi:hypothetical protein